MSMSTDVRSSQVAATRWPEETADVVTLSERNRRVDVLFPLVDEDEWPPYPAENIEAVLLADDLAEIVGVPWFVANLSRGDIVRVHHDGIGYVGGAILSRGGHSTLHVIAADEQELATVVRELTALGAEVRSGLQPPMLAVDVSERVALSVVVKVLTAAESMTCAFTVACDQHRTRVAGG